MSPGHPPFVRETWSQLRLPPDVAAVGPAIEVVREDLRAHGASADAMEDVRLGLSEALTNAVLHGAAAPGVPDVWLRWSWTGDGLTVEVSEPGQFVPPPTWAELPEDPLQENGRGGFLITQHFDDVHHANSAGRHALTLRKRLGPRLSPAASGEASPTAPPPGPGEAGHPDAVAGVPRARPVPPAAPAEDLELTLAGMTEELSASYETLASLFKLAEALATAADLSAFVEQALNLRALAEADAMHVRVADAFGNLQLLGSDGGAAAPPPQTLHATAAAVEQEVFRTGNERTLDATTPLAPADPLHGLAGAAFVCPIHFQGRRQGVCVLTRHRRGAYFTAGQLALARTTAEFLGIACANAEAQAQRLAQLRAQRELEIAAQIQQSLVLTEFPQRADWAVYGLCLNATEAGGDFFDVLQLGGGMLVFIADVMGKGVPAALLSVVLRTALRAHAPHAARPGDLLNQIAVQLAPDLERLGMFITAQAVFVNADRREMTYANAGHGPLLILGPTPQQDRLLDEGGLPLGVSAAERYTAHQAELQPGERLLLVTDGIVEAVDEAGQELGLAGLRELAPRGPMPALGIACAELLVKLKRRDGERPQLDDRTLLLLESLS